MVSESAGYSRDVRMRGFARRRRVEEAVAWVDAQAKRLSSERVGLWRASGRVLAVDVVSSVDVPGFDRSMMDGYALAAADTLGATAYNCLELRIVGQSLAGKPLAGVVSRGEAALIMTGAPLPAGADAVLPAERAEVENGRLRLLDEVPPGKNVGRQGEDVAAGTTVLQAGRVLRPQDLGLLSSIGLAEVDVVRRPRVRIVVTGNELLPAGSAASGHRIVDANGPMLAALVERDGGVGWLGNGNCKVGAAAASIDPHPGPLPEGEGEKDASRSSKHPHPGPLPEGEGEKVAARSPDAADYLVADDPGAILAAVQDDVDVVLVSGGSSVGQEDHAPLLLAQHGELAIHGIAMRPSSPTGMGRLGERIVFLLPGNPVSCLCAYDFFAGRAIRLLGGRSADWPYPKQRLPLARKLVSQVGRVDYARVRIAEGRVEPLAISGASILTTTTAADGFVVVPADSEGYPAGAEVDVFLYDLP